MPIVHCKLSDGSRGYQFKGPKGVGEGQCTNDYESAVNQGIRIVLNHQREANTPVSPYPTPN